MEFSGFAGKFRCFCKEEFKDSLFSSPLFQQAHPPRRMSCPQYVRRCEFRVIFAG
jgi:hypothetical protein